MKPKRALSIRQPFAEQILSGKKKCEYRGTQTKIRERVYVYASKSPARRREWKETGFEPGQLPTGVIVGSVEIAGCEWRSSRYEWKLARPKRLKRRLTPKNKPQPVWFHPF